MITADATEDVAPALAAVERAVDAGDWAFGFVTYEAGRALAGLPVQPAAEGAAPLLWFGLCAEPEVVDLVRPGNGELYQVGPWVNEVSRAEYTRRVEDARQRIAAGDIYQANLTSLQQAAFSGDPESLYSDLACRQRGAHNMFVDTGETAVLSASPELFYERCGDHVTMRPMKGTVGRGRDVWEDADLVSALRTSTKDRAENVMIVDLVRNDLARIAEVGSVQVATLCAVERFETVHQLTSDIGAQLRPDVTLVDLFGALFPSGSVTGAPKRRAMQIIDELESGPRGVYCGAVGYLAPPGAGTRARFNVAIRTVVVDRAAGTATYGAGGGITWASDPDAEYEEMIAKSAILHGRSSDFELLETMRSCADGSIHLLDRHLDRLAASAEYFGFAYDEAGVRRRLLQCGAVAPSRVRVALSREGRVTVTTGAVPAAGNLPVRLAVDPTPVQRDSPWLRHKTTDRTEYERRRARHPDADEVVMVNADGEVTETTISSILVCLDGRWYTPPLDSGCLPGIGRAALLDRGQATERIVRVDDLYAADELAVVNAVRGRRAAVLIG